MENRSEAPDFLKRLRVQTEDRNVAPGHDNAIVPCLGEKKKGILFMALCRVLGVCVHKLSCENPSF